MILDIFLDFLTNYLTGQGPSQLPLRRFGGRCPSQARVCPLLHQEYVLYLGYGCTFEDDSGGVGGKGEIRQRTLIVIGYLLFTISFTDSSSRKFSKEREQRLFVIVPQITQITQFAQK